jgi:phosphoribosylanthranilate isomerase
MTWIKICGTTNLEDAQLAVDAGVDAVGFVFHEKSPRNIDVPTARELVRKLPDDVEKIGVFVIGDEVEPRDIMLQVGLTGAQSYARDTGATDCGWTKAAGISCLPSRARFLMSLPMNLIAADDAQIRSLAANFAEWRKDRPADSSLPNGLIDTIVLDSGSLQQLGGTGRIFDWEKAIPIGDGMRQGGVNLVVAGGLTPENVGEAIRILKPWGVDVVSGVEQRPGKKDPVKVRAFVKAVREADKKTS